MTSQTPKFTEQDKIKFYQNALASVNEQITDENRGLILDDGTVRADLINVQSIMELEKRKAEYEEDLSKLLGE